RVPGMGLTWLDAAAMTLIVVEAAFLAWLLRHRAMGSRAQRLLEDRLRFETLLSDLSAKLIHVDASGLDAALGAALRQVVAFLGMDRGNLDEYIEGRPGARVSWTEPGIEKLPPILAAGHFVWTAGTLRRGGVVRFRRTDALPAAAAADRAGYERLGTRSHLSIPLQAGGPMLGVLSFDSVRAERDWPDELVDRLRLLGEAFAGALERRRMEPAFVADAPAAERRRRSRLAASGASGRHEGPGRPAVAVRRCHPRWPRGRDGRRRARVVGRAAGTAAPRRRNRGERPRGRAGGARVRTPPPGAGAHRPGLGHRRAGRLGR